MSREEIFENVREGLIEVLDLEDDTKILESDRIVEDLEADSLDFVDLIIKLEKKFDIEIEDEELQGKATVGEIVDFVQEKIK